MCIPAEDEADRLAGAMMATLLRARGHETRTTSARAASDQVAGLLRAGSFDCAVISGVAPGGAMQAREGSRRIKESASDIRIVVGLWNANGSLEGTRERLSRAGAEGVYTTFSEAMEFIRTLAERRAGHAAAEVEAAREA